MKKKPPANLPGKELSKERAKHTQAFKDELAKVKANAKATNEAIAASATRYLLELPEKLSSLGARRRNKISSQTINLWISKPKQKTWTTSIARVPTDSRQLAALALSLLQHQAWGTVADDNKACRKQVAEWADMLELPHVPDEVFRLLTSSDDPSKDVPGALDAHLSGIFDCDVRQPEEQTMRALLCIVAVSEPSIHHNARGLDELITFIERGGCYAILSPFNPKYLPILPHEYGAIVQHYRKIHQECIRVINIIRNRIAAASPDGAKVARERVKLLRPTFQVERAAAYRMFSPVVGTIARPVLCLLYNTVSGSETSRFATMYSEPSGMRLVLHVDHNLARQPSDLDLLHQSLVHEYCSDLIGAWTAAGRLQIPDKLKSDIWEIEP